MRSPKPFRFNTVGLSFAEICKTENLTGGGVGSSFASIPIQDTNTARIPVDSAAVLKKEK